MLQRPNVIEGPAVGGERASYLLEWMLLDDEWLWDAADGGTTISPAAVLPAAGVIYVAAVGDSTAALRGRPMARRRTRCCSRSTAHQRGRV